MSTNGGVSFVVTIYNKLRFLAPVMAAIERQHGDFEREIVLVDDGSTDGSREWLAEYAAGRDDIRLICQPNQGCSGALNTGGAAARLRWIKPVDADDLLIPNTTERLLDGAVRTGAGLSFGSEGFYQEADRDNVIPAPEPDGQVEAIADPLAFMLRRSQFNPSALLVEAELYRRVGGCDPKFRHLQDYSLGVRVAQVAGMTRVGITTHLAPRTAAGRLSDDKARMYQNMNLVLHDLVRDAPELAPRYRRMALARAAGRAFNYARRHHSHPQAWRFGLLAAAAHLPVELPWPIRLPWQRAIAFTCSAFGVTDGPQPSLTPQQPPAIVPTLQKP